MHLVTFVSPEVGAKPRPGAWVGDHIVDLAAAHTATTGSDAFPKSMKALVLSGAKGLAMAQQTLDAVDAAAARDVRILRYRRDEVELLSPIPDPGKFFCVGKNNKTHLEELKKNDLIKEIPREPTGFIKLNEVIVGDHADVARPHGITTLDYEPELTFVVGKRAFRTRREDALSHLMGITLTNDLSARQIQKQEVASGTRFWTCKNMPGFGPVGPFIIPLDEIRDPHDLWVTCKVNGELRIRLHTGNVIFRIEQVIEHFSRWMPLEPGDLIAMGAPSGVAVGQPNAAELYLKPGDVVEVAFEGMPALHTNIIAPMEKTS
jgi:2-keto-4-pentenoate hydratase/2-oxohepta-3-ene-1,7-dioic acid hydratase in catechol pathway